MELLNSVKDPRDSSRIVYKSKVILFTRIISAIFMFASMRKMTAGLNNESAILNVAAVGEQPELKELPHYSTINNYLMRLDPEELENIIKKLVTNIMSMEVFKSGKLRKRYWQVLIDGTRLFTTDEDDSENSLYKVHRNADGTIKRIEYYSYVVEAKLLLPNDIVISIMTVFCKNDEGVTPYEEADESQEKKKQDCELKAFYRMEEGLKELFGKTGLCLTMDSLYACGPVMEICERNNWRYIVRFKPGSIRSISDELDKAAQEKPHRYQAFGSAQRYEFINAHKYQEHYLNIVRYTEDGLKYPFVFITNLPINKNNCAAFVVSGRNRWKIENQGFNNQKNHGYELTHRFSLDGQATKNHYFLIQIAHAISQLFEKEFAILKELKLTMHEIHELIKRDFMSSYVDVHTAFSETDSV